MDSKSPSSIATPAPSQPKSGGSAARKTGRARAGQYVTLFRLSGKLYALDVAYVGEIVVFNAVTPVPLTPPSVLGMCNLRGMALAVVDLSLALELPEQHAQNGAGPILALVLRTARMLAGARIDSADSVAPFVEKNFQPRTQGEHPAVQGLLRVGESGKNVATLLDGEELIARLEALQFKKEKNS